MYGTNTPGEPLHKFYVTMAVTWSKQEEAERANDSSSEDSNDSLLFIVANVYFSEDDMSNNRHTEFLNVVEKPEDWDRREQETNEGDTVFSASMERNEYALFRIWLRTTPLPLSFELRIKHYEVWECDGGWEFVIEESSSSGYITWECDGGWEFVIETSPSSG